MAFQIDFCIVGAGGAEVMCCGSCAVWSFSVLSKEFDCVCVHWTAV